MTIESAPSRIISAASAKRAASLFHYGNLAAAIIPGFAILWFGLSMLVFAVNSHHPDSRVLEFNRKGARHFYPIMAIVLLTIAAGFSAGGKTPGLTPLIHAIGLDTFARHEVGMDPGFLGLIVGMWILLFIIIVPLTIRSLIEIQRTPWRDLTIPAATEE